MKTNTLSVAVLLMSTVMMVTALPVRGYTETGRSFDDTVSPSYGKVLGGDSADTGGSGKLLEVNNASDEQLAAYDAWFTGNEERHLQEVADLVAFPTLAMDPEKGEELVKAAEYLKKKLDAIGMKKAKVHPADGLPLVTAEWTGAKGQPTVLF